MKPEQATRGIAIVCGDDGTVREFLRDDVGLRVENAVGRAFPDIVDEASAAKARAMLEALRRETAAFDWELNVPTSDGTIVSLHFVGAAVEDRLLVVGAASRSTATRLYEEVMAMSNEQMTLLRQALKDLSIQSRGRAERDAALYDELSRLNNELADAQRELAKKNVELARLNEQKNQFLGIAAHDLRNPLEVILIYSQFLDDEAGESLDEQQLKFVRTIRQSSRFMLRLVNDLLDVSRIEAGRLVLDLEPVDLARLVEENVARNRALSMRKRVAVELTIEERPPTMRLDHSKIEQVLDNLISNAVKYSAESTPVEITLSVADGMATITIRDHGPGVPEDAVDRIFKPFERGPRAASSDVKSTGLGLAIVKRIVEGHRGTISVQSKEGEGSTFYVSLPLSSA